MTHSGAGGVCFSAVVLDGGLVIPFSALGLLSAAFLAWRWIAVVQHQSLVGWQCWFAVEGPYSSWCQLDSSTGDMISKLLQMLFLQNTV